MFPLPRIFGRLGNMGGSYPFSKTWDFTQGMPSDMLAGHARAGSALTIGPTGMYEWAPENLLLNSATLSTQNITTVASSYTLTFTGTGTVTLSGTSTSGPLVGTGASDRVSLTFTATAGTLTLTVSGSVTTARLQRGTISRSADDSKLATTSAAKYLPRVAYDSSAGILTGGTQSGTVTALGYLGEEQRTNLCAASATVSTDTTYWGVVTGWTIAPVLSSIDGSIAYQHTSDGTVDHARKITVTLSNSTAYAISAVLELPTSNPATVSRIGLYNSAGSAWLGRASFTWATEVLAQTDGTISNLRVENLGTGPNGGKLRRISGSVTTGTEASRQLWIQPVGAAGATTAAVVHQGQLEAGTFATSPIVTSTTSGTRVADTMALTGTAFVTRQNLATFSEVFSNAAWVKSNATVDSNTASDPNGYQTADTITATNANATVLQTFTATAQAYTFSIYLKRSVGTGDVSITVDGATYVVKVLDGTLTRFDTTLTPAAGSKTFGIKLATSGDAVIAWGAQLETGSAATGYLRTGTDNLLTYTHEFDNAAWSKTRSSVTANAVTAPDGTLSADKLVEDNTAGDSHYLGQNNTTTAAAYAFSVYLKAAERGFALLYHSTSNAGASFNLSTGAINAAVPGLVAPVSYSAEDAGGGWWRCVVVVNATAAVNPFRVYTMTDASTFAYNGDNASGIYLWGAKLQLGSVATPYVRPETITGREYLFYNPSEGTFVVRGYVPTIAAQQHLVNVDLNVDANNRISMRADSIGRLFADVVAGSTTYAAINSGATAAVGTVFCQAMRYKINDIATSVNGAAEVTDTGATLPIIAAMRVLNQTSGVAYNGIIRSIRYSRRALSNLAQLSTL